MSDLNIPAWVTNEPDPCPCGRPPFGDMLLVEGPEGDTILAHRSCVTEVESDDE